MAWFPAAVMAVTCPDNGNLTEPSVSPGTGTTATTFTFSVKYQDNLAETPDWIRVYFSSGLVRTLNLQSGSLATGAIYSRTVSGATLGVGTWGVTFRVQPGTQPAPILTCEVSGGSVTVTTLPSSDCRR